MSAARAMGDLPPSLGAALRRSAARRPAHPALAFYGATISYAALLDRVERLAAFLQHRQGLAKGDRVLLCLQNSPQYVVAFQAVVRAGGVVVPANPMYLADELAHLVADSGARLAVVGAELLDRLDGLGLGCLIVAAYRDALPDPCPFPLPPVMAESVLPAGDLPAGAVPWAEAMAEGRPPRPDDCEPGDLCVLPYTSGTTGRPKACMHTHGSTAFTAVAQAAWYGFGDDTVVTGFMPLFHVAGMQISMGAALAAGATTVLMTRWDRDLVAPLFLHHGVDVWSAAPTMVVDVLAAPEFDARALDGLRVLTGGGAPMPEAVAETLLRRWGLRFVEGYGMSETISPTHINPLDWPRPGRQGLPIPETEARIVDPATLAELPPGEVGELIVAGPQLMRGYWRRPDADAEVFLERDGRRFLRTGDLGRVDKEGYLQLVDRLKRMINVSGYKVWPAECEAILFRHPAIQECCVVAAPDSHRGETVKAFVVLRPGAGLDAAALAAWARGEMAAYKVPRIVEFVAALPRTASNKVDWRRLQQG